MGVKITDGFDAGDDEKVISILKKWKGGVISDNLFATISKLSPQVSVIVTVFRMNEGRREVLLLTRPKDDPTWPGMLNLPGKMLRTSDFKRSDGNPVNGALERIKDDELKKEFAGKPRFAGIAFQNTERGSITALVHIAELSDYTDTSGEWVWADVTKLSGMNNLIKAEPVAVKVALKAI